MLCVKSRVYEVFLFDLGRGQLVRSYKDRASLQFALRRRFGSGGWRIRGSRIEARLPFSGGWAMVGQLDIYTDLDWVD